MVESETIMEQAAMTADSWLVQAIACIDDKFGDGYARENPQLVGAFMQAAAMDQQGMYVRFGVIALDDIANAIAGVSFHVEHYT